MLWKRILVEKRTAIGPLALALLVNVGVYAFVVYPLGVKSRGAAARAQQATSSLKAAEADYTAARALVSGTTKADQELATFYDKVLPAGFSSARQLTASSIPELAKKSGVRLAQRRTEVDDSNVKKTGLARLNIHVVLEGDYDRLRSFIYELESAPDFVIIDAVALSQNEAAKPLVLAVDLSTYFRPGANGN
ncbi:MAG TPA: GspMb/PilO family protein [Vicinamibacterales bacterium]|nr:GspMb/PilO family protein [Vicinamibacterales bacterium]